MMCSAVQCDVQCAVQCAVQRSALLLCAVCCAVLCIALLCAMLQMLTGWLQAEGAGAEGEAVKKRKYAKAKDLKKTTWFENKEHTFGIAQHVHSTLHSTLHITRHTAMHCTIQLIISYS